jgi:hypothetical protein
MIMAEVKYKDGGDWDTRLYNCSMSQFQSMADKRFVAVGKVLELPTGSIVQYLRRMAGWNEVEAGRYVRPKHY